jgi:endo-alpha-1,4-polygalactosaminidase (GH114 family)
MIRSTRRVLVLGLVLLLGTLGCVPLQSSDISPTRPPAPYAAAPLPGTAIWQPRPGTTWQWQLKETIDTSFDVEMYDIDLFDAPQATIDQLHNDGRIVICYFSAGSWENWRDDASAFPEAVLGNTLDGWPDEKWLDIRQIEQIAPVLTARLDLAVSKQCDGVEPDNVDGYANDSGFPLVGNDQLAFNRWLAQQAHSRGLSIPDLVGDFDWALNEQCYEFNECDRLLPFVQAGKAVFGVEYSGDPALFCPQANAAGYSWLKKNLDLDAERFACQDQPAAISLYLPSILRP